MNVLRRPEVIALVALVLVGLGWVASNRRRDVDPPPKEVAELTLLRSVATPDGTHQRLRLEFSVRHSLPQAIDVRAPNVRLLDAAGTPVPEFFHPGEFPPTLPPGVTAASWAEFWLNANQAAGPLTLEIAGKRVDVRPAW